MSTYRKVCTALMFIIYSFGVFPPLMSIYNRPASIGGIPVFVIGVLFFSLSMILICYVLYRHELKTDPDVIAEKANNE